MYSPFELVVVVDGGAAVDGGGVGLLSSCSLQAKLIEKNRDTRRDRKIADFIVLFTLQRLVSECSPI